ncbi:MAG: hypothetical protein NVSMB9_25270 [Isosphaeraceae bacterium]
MRRVVASLTLGVSFLSTSAALALEDTSGSSTAPPEVSGPVAVPRAPLPRVIESTPIAGRAAVLAVPGLTTPGARSRRSPTNSLPTTAPDSSPPLVGPAEMPAPDPARGGSTLPEVDAIGSREESLPPLTLESIPSGPGERLDAEPPQARNRAGRENPPSRRLPSPRRPLGLFGRFLPAVPGDRGRAQRDGSISVEPPSAREPDVVLKERIERQIREKLGSRVKWFEVRIDGREVKIRAHPARFYQRRAVRRELQALPSLRGYRSAVELMD